MFSPRTHPQPTDDFEVEYHLTPRGWVRGCEWFFGKMQADTPAPPDRVLTLKKRVFQPSAAAQREVTWFTLWRDPRVGETELASLQKRFVLPDRS